MFRQAKKQNHPLTVYQQDEELSKQWWQQWDIPWGGKLVGGRAKGQGLGLQPSFLPTPSSSSRGAAEPLHHSALPGPGAQLAADVPSFSPFVQQDAWPLRALLLPGALSPLFPRPQHRLLPASAEPAAPTGQHSTFHSDRLKETWLMPCLVFIRLSLRLRTHFPQG